MLVIARHKGQSLYLFDGKVKIQIIGIQGNIVRLGLDLPKEVDCLTEEKMVAEWARLKGEEDENSKT